MQIWQKLQNLEEEGEAFGLIWPNAETILEQIESECREIRACLQEHSQTLQEEIGDLLHAATSLAWYCGFDSKLTLNISCTKFSKRLAMMKDLAKQQGYENMQGKSFEELMALWDKAKQRLAKPEQD